MVYNSMEFNTNLFSKLSTNIQFGPERWTWTVARTPRDRERERVFGTSRTGQPDPRTQPTVQEANEC